MYDKYKECSEKYRRALRRKAENIVDIFCDNTYELIMGVLNNYESRYQRYRQNFHRFKKIIIWYNKNEKICFFRKTNPHSKYLIFYKTKNFSGTYIPTN